VDDSAITAPPDDWLSENLLWHFQRDPNRCVPFELNIASKMHAAFGEIGCFNGVFGRTALVEPANSDGDV
jgi:hypothetical protein